ncbi:hypothetical protein RchiOBHm_Chr2g0175871 [Rosa chinensis]|uniref:Uncharacterized protein n=1 Tax=Rosa chinensis TaxID=74649 RepID=A0A2P6S6I3_ROSCH|nr:uncharacterized protein LOC112189949 [Rosa chinensis]PRQ54291.1 hypothetical protein RchiOBHm_Chr2g0175871 [Rosa chinensis]
MESNRKRRGFMKGKLTPFYRVSKPSSTSTTTTTSTTSKQSSMQYMMSSKVQPSQAYPLPSSVGFLVHNRKDYHVIATQVQAQPKQKITFIVPPSPADRKQQQQQQQLDHNLAGDEMVDMKAATYISSVQERFKLERNN